MSSQTSIQARDRTAKLIGHILPLSDRRMLEAVAVSQESSSAGAEGKQQHVTPALNMRDYAEYDIRTYRVGEDDELYRKLDKLCAQGVKTKLITDFLLKHPFEEVQPNGWCAVALYKGEMVGCLRSYTYESLINGTPATCSYVFLARVHPDHRRKNLAIYLGNMVYFHDLTSVETDYFTLWVVADNVASLNMQEKFSNLANERHGLPSPDLMQTYHAVGLSMEEFRPLIDPSLYIEFGRTHSVEKIPADQEVALLKRFHGDKQFLPTDLEKLSSFELNLGTYVLRNSFTKEIEAAVTIWNSGAVRVNTIGDYSSKGAVLLYNAWHKNTERGRKLIRHLTECLALDLQKKGFLFVFVFYSEQQLGEYISVLKAKSKIVAAWRARVYYQINTVRVDATKDIFYDPRQCLV